MNPFLQILGVDPEIKTPDGLKTGDNIIGVFGEEMDTEKNIDFDNLLANIDVLNTDSDKIRPLMPNINDKSILQILSGLGPNKIPTDSGNPEKIEITLSADNNAKTFIPNDNVIKSLENKTFTQIEPPRTESTKTISLQQPQLNPETEIQKLLLENQPVAFRTIPTNLPEIQSPTTNSLTTNKNDLTAFMTALNDKERANIPKTGASEILFKTNIQNAEKTNQPVGNDIFNQKLNLLNLRQVELTEKHIKPATDLKTSRSIPIEKVPVKADFDIPTLIRAIPVGPSIKNGAAVRIAPHTELPVSNIDELLNSDIVSRPAMANADTTGNNNSNNLLMNDPATGKGPGGTSAKIPIGGFAKSLGGEMAASSLNDITKMDNVPVKSEETTVRFIAPNKLLENGRLVNQTITIKMEPEHLGTIRLTLSSINHGLIGRMVVENAAAHAIVESNIDNLFSELSDKGVKLEAFSVSVGADSEGKKSTQGRKPFRMNNRDGGNKDKNRLDAINPAIAGAVSNRMYINSNGVNWLA